MTPKQLSILYILSFFLFYFETSNANNYFQNIEEHNILSLKKKKTRKLCNKAFYLNNIEVNLSSKGLLTTSLTQISKTSEGYHTYIAVEILDKKERVLTVFKTGRLELEDEEESKSYFFTENLNYQFSPEEFKIFIENAKGIRIGYKGCDEEIPEKKEKITERKLPEGILLESSNKKYKKTKLEKKPTSNYVVLSNLLHLRKYARAKGSTILHTLKKGDVVDIIEKRDSWWLIQFYSPTLKKRYVGFVHSDYLLPLEFSY